MQSWAGTSATSSSNSAGSIGAKAHPRGTLPPGIGETSKTPDGDGARNTGQSLVLATVPGRKKGCGSVALVIMGHGPAAPIQATAHSLAFSVLTVS